jgi:hypothetical protein
LFFNAQRLDRVLERWLDAIKLCVEAETGRLLPR